MVVEVSSGTARVQCFIGVTVYLVEELFRCGDFGGHHKSMIAVVARPPVAFLEILCHGNLGYLLAITKDPEFSLTRQDFLSCKKCDFPAQQCQFKIGQYLFFLQGLLSLHQNLTFIQTKENLYCSDVFKDPYYHHSPP